MCEYEVNPLTNDKVITEIKLFNKNDKVVQEQCYMSRLSEGQSHNAACLRKGIDLSNNVREYEVDWLTNEKVIRGKQNFNEAGRLPARPPRTD